MKLSICMIVKNEEKYLEGCLKSLRKLTDTIESELIIVDTGSGDNTVEIAKKYTNKVYFHSWENDFAKARNISISYASGKWVLIIDADEEIDDCTDIINFLTSKDSKFYDSCGITIKNIVYEETDSGYGYSTAVRLFKKTNSLSFVGSIHENPNVNTTKYINSTFIHYGYITGDKELIEIKFKRNSQLLIDELKKDPENIEYRFYLSSAYKKHKDYKKALDEIIIAYNLVKNRNLNLQEYLYIYSQLAFCLVENNKFEDAVLICKEGLEYEPNHIDLHFCLAGIDTQTGNYQDAINHYCKYLEISNDDKKILTLLKSVHRLTTQNNFDIVYINLSFIYLLYGKYDFVWENVKKVNLEHYGDKAFSILLEMVVISKQFNELKDYYNNYIKDVKNNNAKKLFFSSLISYQSKLAPNTTNNFSVANAEQFLYQLK